MTSGRELFKKALSDIDAETAICTDILESRGVNVYELRQRKFLVDIKNILDNELSDGT